MMFLIVAVLVALLKASALVAFTPEARKMIKGFLGAHLRVIVPGQHSSFRRNVANVASCRQHCV